MYDDQNDGGIQFHQQYQNETHFNETKGTNMGFNATKGNNDFEIAPAGVHPARCYKIIDLGHQQTTWQGKPKIAHKIIIAWELLGDERMADGQPFMIQSRYTLSLGDNAHLKKALESWRGKPFTIEENLNFDVSKVLGAYCLLNVVHATEGDNTYANVSSLMPLPKSMGRPEGVNALFKFDIDKPDMAMFESFSEKLQATIAASTEWQERKGAKPAKSATAIIDGEGPDPFEEGSS